jgi:hypothetical protein
MTLDLLQAIGTVVSILAVLISVIGLTIGVRHNTQALRAQNHAHALDRLAAMQARLSADAEMSSMFSRGLRDASALTPEERVQFTWALYEMFGSFEFMFEQSESKGLPPDVWDRWAKTTSWWLSYPGVQVWWRARPAPFNRRFTAFVDACLDKPIHEADAMLRWRGFLWQGSAHAVTDGVGAEKPA